MAIPLSNKRLANFYFFSSQFGLMLAQNPKPEKPRAMDKIFTNCWSDSPFGAQSENSKLLMSTIYLPFHDGQPTKMSGRALT